MNPASERILENFLNPNLPTPMYDIALAMYTMGLHLAAELDSDNHAAGAEVTTGLRKMREAKDCFVLAKVILERGK